MSSETPVESTAQNSSSVADTTGPIPLSFPAFLRNSELQSRLAHHNEQENHRYRPTPTVSRKSARRDDNEGKRWVRRKENSRFVGNPHVVLPTIHDLEIGHQAKSETFPIPLPPYLPHSISLPPTTLPTTNPKASYAGHFSTSLRGARKTIRRAGPITQALVHAVEDTLLQWIAQGLVVPNPDADPPPIMFPGIPVGDIEGVREVQRTHEHLILWIEDAWSRYVVHCCARYHGIVSFSKDTSTHRLTHFLRPNSTRILPANRVARNLATPPTTDPEVSSLSSYDSDMANLSDIASAPELSDIASDAGDEQPLSAPHPLFPVSDNDGGDESDLGSLAESLGASALRTLDSQSEADELANATRQLAIDDETPRARRIAPLRASAWERARSGSSPSRSPARRERHPRRGRRRAKISYEETGNSAQSFYEYLFK